MILIDDDQTILAGHAGVLLLELGTAIDRILAEIARGKGEKNYDELMDTFLEVTSNIKDIREEGSWKGTGEEFSASLIMKHPKLRSILPQNFFGGDSKNEPEDDSKSILEQAVAKLAKAKKAKSKKNK